MLTRMDRVLLATDDRAAAARGWVELLGAEHLRDDRAAHLGARRSTWQVGRSLVEFLEPDGDGPVADSMTARGRPHLFAAGVSTSRLDDLVGHVQGQGIECTTAGDEAFVTLRAPGQNPLHFLMTADVERNPVGLIDNIYEATILTDSYQPMLDAVTALCGLDSSHYCPITSQHFRYDGVLTLFDPDQPDRFEVIHPTSNETTMGRFHSRCGRAWYMAYAETPHMLEIERRAGAAGAGLTVERPAGRSAEQMADAMWLHPPALGGMMLGLSRPSQVWSWSGRPERVIPL